MGVNKLFSNQERTSTETHNTIRTPTDSITPYDAQMLQFDTVVVYLDYRQARRAGEQGEAQRKRGMFQGTPDLYRTDLVNKTYVKSDSEQPGERETWTVKAEKAARR
ncbi:hypothetical protein FRC10_009641, partial [Ceratobasidium sp. 414]